MEKNGQNMKAWRDGKGEGGEVMDEMGEKREKPEEDGIVQKSRWRHPGDAEHKIRLVSRKDRG